MNKTREQWLQEAAEMARMELFHPADFMCPAIQVSVGFPSGGTKNKRIGECWTDTAADDEMHHIFISPVIDDGVRAMDILIHEMVHATVGIKAGHNHKFRKCALAVGLTGKMTSTLASEGLTSTLQEWLKELGTFPHGKLNLSSKKKQKSRQILVYCHDNCTELKVRLAQTWIDLQLTPLCPKCVNPMLPKDDES